MSGHTPWPWRCDDAGPEDAFAPMGGCGCCGSPWVNGADKATRAANARLIAAAPELLEALKACLTAAAVNFDAGERHDPIMAEIGDAIGKARVAIAKAEGRS